ncbi:MAG TPA: MXAN_5187 C-terminal domain-containing protein [Vicinamibacteria bacterium]|nr:MXAN_5187 C-terminal domain-containing protein [Vicinamibacteria bacterium]
MAVSEDLEKLELWIRQIQIEWEKFFSGIEKKPPTDFKFRLEKLIRSYAGTEMRNNTERFRYNTLTARYNTFNELWQKRLRAMEEGRAVGLHGRAANRPVTAAFAAMAGVPALAHAVAAATGEVAGVSEHEAPGHHPPAAPRDPNEIRVGDPGRDQTAVKALYERFTEMRKKAGEGTVQFGAFEKLIGQQASRLITEKGAKAVDFRLEVKDGKVSLKAKPVR